MNPRKAVYFCNRALASFHLQKYEEAVSDANMTIELSPNYGNAYLSLGLAYSSLQKPLEAKSALDRAMLLEPRPSRASHDSNSDLTEEVIAKQQKKKAMVERFHKFVDFIRQTLCSNVGGKLSHIS